jgi:N-acetylglucosaminyl-diphospho-decaprenol L-rhamnosyltransferase
MTTSQSLSVVIVSYHTGPALWSCLDSLRNQNLPLEIILVNNGNPPDVEERLRHYASQHNIALLTDHGNVGFGTACNMGAIKATGPWLLFLNPDCVLSPNLLSIVLEEANTYPTKTMFGARLLDEEGREQSGSRRNTLTPLNAVLDSVGIARALSPHYRFNLHRAALPNKPTEVEAISGAFMLLRLDDFNNITGFDTAFFLHVEDLDLCLRFRQAGGKIVFLPHLNITHIGHTSHVSSAFVEWNKTKSFIRYFHKHFQRQYTKPVLWFIDSLIILRFFLKTLFGYLKNRRA